MAMVLGRRWRGKQRPELWAAKPCCGFAVGSLEAFSLGDDGGADGLVARPIVIVEQDGFERMAHARFEEVVGEHAQEHTRARTRWGGR